MPKLTPPKAINDWLTESVDETYYNSRYRMAQKVFDPAGTQSVASEGGAFPDYPDILAVYKEMGITTQILQSQVATMGSILTAVPAPEFAGIKYKEDGDILKGFWAKRTQSYITSSPCSNYADGYSDIHKAWLDGDGMGMGFVRIGLKTDKNTGFRRTCLKHVPILQMIWDRYVRSFCDAKMACEMTYLPLHEAINLFGRKRAKDNIYLMNESGAKSQLQCVRVFEYFDLGYEGGEPTSCILLGDISKEPIERDENPYGCLPFGHMENLLFSGQRRAIGRIDILHADQEALNDMERAFRNEAKRVGFDVVSSDLLDEEGIADVKAGKVGVVVTTERPMEKGDVPYTRVPGGEISQTALAYYQNVKESFRSNAGQSELEQGSDVEGADTLGEVKLVDQRSKTMRRWTEFQTARFFQRTVGVFLKVAMLGDDEPFRVQADGDQFDLNVPGNPNLSIAQFIDQEYEVVVSREALMNADVEQEKAVKLAGLQALDPEVQMGLVDPIWRTEQKLKVLGYDPKEAMPPAQMGLGMPGADPMGDPAAQQPPAA